MKRQTYNALIWALVLPWVVGIFILKEHFGWQIGSAEYMFYKIVGFLLVAAVGALIFRKIKIDDDPQP